MVDLIQNIKTLSPSELKVILYMQSMNCKIVESHDEIARTLSMSSKSVGTAFRTLEARGIINYERGTAFKKNVVSLIQ
jgi:DNA-binding MarR family transcriptional regulator